ncbi:MAG: hypothetical protein V1867_04755 [Candidatus Falkowbacteria bacterium]
MLNPKIKINKRDALKKLTKIPGLLTRFGYGKIGDLAQTVSDNGYYKERVKAYEKEHGLDRQMIKKIEEGLGETEKDRSQISREYKWVRNKVDGYINPTIDQKIVESIKEGKSSIKQIINQAKRDQAIYHRRLKAGHKDYARNLQKGRFAIMAERKASALDKALTSGTGEIQRRKALGLSYGGGGVSALSGDPEKTASLTTQGGSATAVNTEAHGVAAAIGSKQEKTRGNPGSMPSPLGGKLSPFAGGGVPPIGFSKKF